MLTLSELSAIMPYAGSRASIYVEPLNASMEEFKIDTPDRLSALLAQIAVESQELRRVEENLMYTTTAQLCKVWPTKFKTDADAKPFIQQPAKLANYVYANLYGNGDMQSGDGWLCRGAGLIQVTFRSAHAACAHYFGLPFEGIGEWLRTPEGAARSMGWYWKTRGLNTLADQGRFNAITRRINPGMAGASERVTYWERAKHVLA